MKGIIAGVVGVVVIILCIALAPFTSIDTGTKGVVTRGGAITGVLDEGFQFKNPIDDVTEVNVQVQKTEVTANAASKDLQTVTTQVALTYQLDATKVTSIYSAVRNDYSARYIEPALQESVKAATSQFTAEEMVTKRESVREVMRLNITAKLDGTGVIVRDFNITNFDFSPQFNAAIEAKVTAEQKAKEAQNKLVQVEAEAKQKVAQAQAEAESIRLQGAAANSDKYIQLKQLEVQAEFAKKWNGVLPVNLYGSAPIPFLNLGK